MVTEDYRPDGSYAMAFDDLAGLPGPPGGLVAYRLP